MGKTLRIYLTGFGILLLSLLTGFAWVNSVHGQVSVSNHQSFELSFTDDQTSKMGNAARIDIQDFDQLTGHYNATRTLSRFTSSPESQNDFYYVQTQGGMALGRYYQQFDDAELLNLQFENSTSHSFRELSVAFDFIFLPVNIGHEQSFHLSYRVNDGDWVNPREGTFSSSFLRTNDEGWNTFSMQIMLDQLYVRPGDKVEMKWNASSDSDTIKFIPIALQKTELNPTVSEERNLRPGSVIISELFPLHQMQGRSLEYIELYNSTGSQINLRGLRLEAGRDHLVIQRDLIAEPYQTVLLANYSGIPEFEGKVDYIYSGTVLGNSSGMLKADVDGQEIAKAAFEVTEPAASIELDHMVNAYDGYSGLRYFQTSNSEFMPQFYGSPGVIEQQKKLYSIMLADKGWHFIDPPGQLIHQMNRDLEGELYYLQPDLEITELESREVVSPLLMYQSGNNEQIIYSAGEPPLQEVYSSQTKDESELKHKRIQLLKNPFVNTFSIDQIENSTGEQAFPVIMTWNSKRQQFELIWHVDQRMNPWDALFTPAIEDEIKYAENPEENERWNGLQRLIRLSVTEKSSNRQNADPLDEAIIGFKDLPEGLAAENFSLPKIWTPLSEDQQQNRSGMIYLKSAGTETETNSYLQLNRTPAESIQTGVGIRLNNLNEQYSIKWDGLETLPDQWVIEFVDTETNEVVNMEDYDEYSFYVRSNTVSNGMDDAALSLNNVSSIDYDRFYIRISTTEALNNLEEDQAVESIQLKQNYPNPFNPATTISFYLPESKYTKVGIYNVVGQQVGLLVEDNLSAGEHTVSWNASDMPSGVYIVQLEAGNTVLTRKITLIK